MLKHTYRTSIADGSGSGISDVQVFTASANEQVSDVAPAGDTLEVDIAVDVSKIVSFFVESDQDVRLDTNSEGTNTADQTFDLAADKALWWNTDRHDECPLDVDITKLFFVNEGTKDANVRGGFLVDLTI